MNPLIPRPLASAGRWSLQRLSINGRFRLVMGLMCASFLMAVGPLGLFLNWEERFEDQQNVILKANDAIHAFNAAYLELRALQIVVEEDSTRHGRLNTLFGECGFRLAELQGMPLNQAVQADLSGMERMLILQARTFEDHTQSLAEQRHARVTMQAAFDAVRTGLLQLNRPELIADMLVLELHHDNFIQAKQFKPLGQMRKNLSELRQRLQAANALKPDLEQRIESYLEALQADLDMAVRQSNQATAFAQVDSFLAEFTDRAHRQLDTDLLASRNESERLMLLAGLAAGGGGALGLAVMALIIRILARTLVQPLGRLSALVAEFRSGNLEARHQWTCGDEIDILGQTLNDLAADVRRKELQLLGAQRELEEKLHRLAASEAELLDHRENLERDVAQRTTALTKAVNNLELQIERRRAVEGELVRARDAAQASNQAKSQFLANMSHEIRTPMNAIMGMSGLLLDTRLEGEQREFASIIRSSAEALLKVINDILDVSKIEAGKLDLELLDFDLRRSLEDLADLMAYRAGAKGLEFVLRIAPDVPVWVRGDPDRLRQVLLNLSENALKFTQRGEVMVDVSLLERMKGADAGDCLLRFAVTDTGIGIPPDRMNRLFKAFSQVDASTTRRFGGTGLGLTICKALAEMMGGGIGVESRSGAGSTFWFTARMPASALADGPQALCDQSVPPFLVVDDVAANRRLVREYLASWGCECDEASGGMEGLEMLRRAAADGRPYKVALLDGRMDDMDGLETARLAAADPLLRGLSVVLLTSLGAVGQGADVAQGIISAVLNKPIKAKALHDTLAMVLGRSGAAAHGGQAAAPQPARQAAPASREALHILLVEDNAFNQKLMQALLAKHGHAAMVANNGLEALEVLASRRFDLVLMDVQMPEMDGFQATAVIRDRTSAVLDHDVPVVALTAHAMAGYRDICLRQGMDDYLTKPTSEADLLRVLDGIAALRDGLESDGPGDTASFA